MTQDELDLIHSYLNETLSEAGFARLQTLLRENAEARRTLRSLSTVDTKLQQLAAVNPATLRLLSAPAVSEIRRGFAWLSWRPLTAAAAGIVFGMLCASVVFGYATARTIATSSRLFALVDGSFEKVTGRVASGFPSGFGKWSGDDAEIVSGNAKDGKQALRFVQAEREPRGSNSGAGACDVFQLVDLRPLKAESEPGETTLELSAQFLDARGGPGEKVRFVARLHLFAGSPEGLGKEWPLPRKEALATGSGIAFSTGESPQTWQSVTTKVFLPQEADFAVVHLLVNIPESWPNRTTPATFGAQYADDVRLTLKTQPALPVRLAER
jgi:hypothetical protein